MPREDIVNWKFGLLNNLKKSLVLLCLLFRCSLFRSFLFLSLISLFQFKLFIFFSLFTQVFLSPASPSKIVEQIFVLAARSQCKVSLPQQTEIPMCLWLIYLQRNIADIFAKIYRQSPIFLLLTKTPFIYFMLIMQIFIISVTVFSNLTKLSNDLFISPIKLWALKRCVGGGIG